MKDVKLEYHDCCIYGDKGYIGADVQLDLFETAHIRLECPYRLNQKDWKPTFIPFAKARKRIETIFSPAEPKGLETDFHSLCKSTQED